MEENVQGQEGMNPENQPENNPQPAALSKDAQNMAMLCHLLAIFTGLLGPLIIWLLKKEDDAFIDDQGKEAINFQISVLLGMMISGILILIVIGFILMIIIGICNLIFCIMGAMAVSEGKKYRYPVCIRFLK